MSPTDALPQPLIVQLAQMVGAHALSGFFALLVVTVLGTGMAVRQLQCRRAPIRHAEPHPLRLTLSFSVGFALLLLASLLFAWLASNIGEGETLATADQILTEAIAHQVPREVLVVFGWLTHLGDFAFLAVVCIVVTLLLWRRAQRKLVLGWVLALIGILVLNPSIKQIYARIRPLHEHGLAFETSYSFPSSHSAGAIVSYGMLLYIALRTLPPRWHVPAAMAAAAAIVTIASSRIFLQVHYASDVAAGLLIGLGWLLLCVGCLEYARHRCRAREQRSRSRGTAR